MRIGKGILLVLLAALTTSISVNDLPAQQKKPKPTKIPGIKHFKPSRCSVDKMAWNAEIVLRRPRKKSFEAFKKLLASMSVKPDLVGCYKPRSIAIRVTTAEARRLFGKKLSLTCVPNAGNSVGRNAYWARVQPKRYIPPKLRRLLKSWIFPNDPKYRLVRENRATPCSKMLR